MEDRSSYESGVPQGQRADFFLYVRAAAGADPATVRAGLAAAVKPIAVVSVQDREQFKDAQAAQVNTILDIISAAGTRRPRAGTHEGRPTTEDRRGTTDEGTLSSWIDSVAAGRP